MNSARRYVAACLALLAAAANATVVYSYQGNLMNLEPPGVGQGSGVYARLEFSDHGALLNWTIGKKDLGFGLGESRSSEPPEMGGIHFRTDADGKVVAWSLWTEDYRADDVFSFATSFNQDGARPLPGYSKDHAWVWKYQGELAVYTVTGAGSWTSTALLPNLALAVPIPEPSGWMLLLLGLAGGAVAASARHWPARSQERSA